MIRLNYISTAQANISDADIEAILDRSRRANRIADVTGLLMYDGKRFLQVLEGEAAAVDAIYDRIRADTRHRACVQLDRRQVDTRAFAGWDMAWWQVPTARGGTTLVETVEAMLATVEDRNLRGLFEGFATVRSVA